MHRSLLAGSTLAALLLAACTPTTPPATPQSRMTFFITSHNPGQGADFGGLAGADRWCQSLADKAGAGAHTWRAYLSTVAMNGQPAVNARDRIGKGPWHNAIGMMVARDLDELHGANSLTKTSALTETGKTISGRGDPVNLHDILTGSKPDGTVMTGPSDTTCSNWSTSGAGSAIVGHHDRMGLRDDAESVSWNASHGTRGCSLDALKTTGGGGLLYCFAAD